MSPALPRSNDQPGGPRPWLWFAGVAALVFAARTREVHLYAGETPMLDQWDAEARQILLPWLEGKLGWSAFFAPHNEHIPLWTRLMAWLQAAVLGRWDPQLQSTVNALFHAAFAGTVAVWLRQNLARGVALGLTLTLVLLAGLPFGWENSTWGFQFHTPLALWLMFLHVRGSFCRPPGSAGWWLAQAAGLAGLFTYGSMWAAPAAVFLTAWWTAATDRRRLTGAAALVAVGLALVMYARSHQAPEHTAALTAHSPREFVAAFLMQLSWPSTQPGAAGILFLPALLLGLQLRRRADADNFDRVTFAIGLWAVAQAAAFAYARGGGYIGFVSRYEDLLAVGVLANGIALWRLLQSLPGRTKWLALALSAAWIALLVPGLAVVSTRGHTEYFQGHSAEWAQTRREAVRNYLSTHDIDTLGRPEVRAVLYPNPEVVARALDQPRLVALLPASLRVSAEPSRGDKFSAIASAMRAHWLWFAWAGAGLLLVSVILGAGSTTDSAAALAWKKIPGLAPLLGVAAIACFALLFLWPNPFRFSAEGRREALLAPPGSVQGLGYEFVNPSTFTKEQLDGAAQLWPDELRGRFHGTFIDGPDFIGIVHSTRFRLTTPWLVVPYSGYIVSPGNGLHLRIEDDAGRVLDEIDCLLPNTTDVGFWPVDVHAYAGRWARVILYDGRDDAEGWVAAASPQPAQDASLAATRQQERAMEPTRYGQNSLGVLASGFLVLAGLCALFRGKPEPR